MNGSVLFPIFRDESARTSSLCAGTCAGWCCARPAPAPWRPRLRTMVTINIFCSPRAPTAADPRRSSGLRSQAQVRIYSHFVTPDILPPTLQNYIHNFCHSKLTWHWTTYFQSQNWVQVIHTKKQLFYKANKCPCWLVVTQILCRTILVFRLSSWPRNVALPSLPRARGQVPARGVDQPRPPPRPPQQPLLGRGRRGEAGRRGQADHQLGPRRGHRQWAHSGLL